jgi:CheY-like chemotaxis protein
MTAKRVLSVGQCYADHGSISRVLQQQFQAETVPVESAAEALERLRRESFALVLVNRVFDADGASGIAFIRQIKNEPALHAVPVMLVSNYEDAQREAEQAGAELGFGKAALSSPVTKARLEPWLRSKENEPAGK